MASPSSSTTIQNRLQRARKTIRDVTNQTLKSIDSYSTVTLKDNQKNDVVKNTNSDNNVVESTSTSESVSASTSASTSAPAMSLSKEEEMDLAMALFGDDEQMRTLVNEEIQNKLTLIEEQLSVYTASKTNCDSHNDKSNDSDNSDIEDNNNNVDFTALVENHNNDNNDNLGMTAALQEEAKDLKEKIQFLQQCTEARMALDEIESLSMMDHVNIRSIHINDDHDVDDSSTTTNNNKGNQQIMMPSSSKPAVLIPIANAISKAQLAINAAEKYLINSPSQQQQQQQQQKTKDIQIAIQVIESIRVQVIRHIAYLDTQISSILDACINISNEQITICNGVVNTSTTATPASGKESNYEGLKVAFHVLSILSEPHFDNNNKLSRTMNSIANEIKQKVIKPYIHDIRSALKDGKKPKLFQCSEHTTQSYSSIGNIVGRNNYDLGSSRLGSSRQRVKKNYVTLQWKEVDGNTAKPKSDSNVSDEKNNSLEWWSDLLNFILSISVFVRKNMILDDQSDSQQTSQQLSSIFGSFLLLEEDMINSFMTARGHSKNSYGRTHESSIGSTQMNKYYNKQVHDSASIMKILIDLLEDECIPSTISSSKLTTLPKHSEFVQEQVKLFESSLVKHNLLQKSYEYKSTITAVTNDQKKQLSHSAESFMTIYAQKQRAKILCEGRKLLLEQDFHDTILIGVNVREQQKANQPIYLDHLVGFPDDNEDMSLFVLHEEKVSVVASNIMKLSIQTMDLAVETDFTVDKDLEKLMPPMLYRTARELFDLYRAIIPSTHSNEISTIPRTAAILHNDCVYFAHKMLSLGLEYKDRFPSFKQEVHDDDEKDVDSPIVYTFLDMVPIFRELAEQTMQDMIKYQMNQLDEVVCPRITYFTDALRENEAVVEWTEGETALQAGLYHLRHLSQSWWNVLSYEVYSRAIASLVDRLYSFYLEGVLKAQDISEPACHYISALFRDTIKGTAELFAINEEFDHSLNEATKYCKLWRKFHAIGEFMSMSLADINVNLSEGTFREVTGVELSHLVTVVYEDSEKRKKLLNLLSKH